MQKYILWFSYWHLIEVHHPLDGVTNREYKLLHFIQLTKFFCKGKKALAFNQDRCCHLTLCLRLILFHKKGLASFKSEEYRGCWKHEQNLDFIVVMRRKVSLIISQSGESENFESNFLLKALNMKNHKTNLNTVSHKTLCWSKFTYSFLGKGKLTWPFSAQRRRISAPRLLALPTNA